MLELLEDIQELRPQFFPSVPRLWNRIYDRVVAQASARGGAGRGGAGRGGAGRGGAGRGGAGRAWVSCAVERSGRWQDGVAADGAEG